jgi:hypothetical protein
MAKRIALVAAFAVLAGCETRPPMLTTPSFQTSPALSARNPADIAVLPIEDGTPDRKVGSLLDHMRKVLTSALITRQYSPLNVDVVDAALSGTTRQSGETILTPGYLKRVAGKSNEDGTMAVRIDRWDEATLMSDKRVKFQIQAALTAKDGELLWNGTLAGEVKAGGAGAAPLDREGMEKSCAELAMIELVNHLDRRKP